MSKPIKVAVIYGSVRNGRLCDAVAGWVADRVEARADYTLDVIDPLAEGLTDLRGTDGATENAIAARLSRADAFIVVTPEYNHSFPAALAGYGTGGPQPQRIADAIALVGVRAARRPGGRRLPDGVMNPCTTGACRLRHTTVSFFAAPERHTGSATKTFKEWS